MSSSTSSTNSLSKEQQLAHKLQLVYDKCKSLQLENSSLLKQSEDNEIKIRSIEEENSMLINNNDNLKKRMDSLQTQKKEKTESSNRPSMFGFMYNTSKDKEEKNKIEDQLKIIHSENEDLHSQLFESKFEFTKRLEELESNINILNRRLDDEKEKAYSLYKENNTKEIVIKSTKEELNEINEKYNILNLDYNYNSRVYKEKEEKYKQELSSLVKSIRRYAPISEYSKDKEENINNISYKESITSLTNSINSNISNFFTNFIVLVNYSIDFMSNIQEQYSIISINSTDNTHNTNTNTNTDTLKSNIDNIKPTTHNLLKENFTSNMTSHTNSSEGYFFCINKTHLIITSLIEELKTIKFCCEILSKYNNKIYVVLLCISIKRFGTIFNTLNKYLNSNIYYELLLIQNNDCYEETSNINKQLQDNISCILVKFNSIEKLILEIVNIENDKKLVVTKNITIPPDEKLMNVLNMVKFNTNNSNNTVLNTLILELSDLLINNPIDIFNTIFLKQINLFYILQFFLEENLIDSQKINIQRFNDITQDKLSKIISMDMMKVVKNKDEIGNILNRLKEGISSNLGSLGYNGYTGYNLAYWYF